MSFLSGGFGASSSGYTIPYSARFRSAGSTYLSRTPGVAGNRQKFTISAWVKRTALGTYQQIFGTSSAGTNEGLYFWNDDTIHLFINGSTTGNLATSAVYRDIAGWYHILAAIDTTNATGGDRMRLYVNGSEVTAFSSDVNPTLNYTTTINNTVAHRWGADVGGTQFVDGYLSDCYLIDGAALTPSSFGQTDANGVWTPKAYSGSYGTNGVFLKFANSGALGTDSSGNGNTYTSSGLASTDQMTDAPTNNYAVINPLDRGYVSGSGATITNGNLTFTAAGTTSDKQANAMSMGMTSGKYYAEFICDAVGSGTYSYVGVGAGPGVLIAGYNKDGQHYNGSWTAGWSSYSATVVIGVALDVGAASVTFYRNNVSQGSISLAAYPMYFFYAYVDYASAFTANFGQRPFTYTPPSGYVALCTANLPAVSITKPKSYHNEVLWTGTQAILSVSGVGFQPDFIWAKSRSVASSDHGLVDSVRGATQMLRSNTSGAELTTTDAVTAFSSDGFTLGANTLTGTNVNFTVGGTYVGWCWKKGAIPGFDIVAATAPSSGTFTIPHSLGAVPAFGLVKSRASGSGVWMTWHKSVGSATDDYMVLNTTATKATSAGIWGTGHTSSNFLVGSGGYVASGTHIAYLWAEIAGFSKFGSYTGNGSTDGPFVYCGFRPRYVLIKKISGSTNPLVDWYIYDASRDQYNVAVKELFANSANSESSGSGDVDLLSNGFKVRLAAYLNDSGSTYIFAAFAENPFGGSNVAPANAR